MKSVNIRISDDQQKDIFLWLVVAITSVVVFFMCGERGYVLFKDSDMYISLEGVKDVMPLYPLFIHIIKLLFGEAYYLYVVVAVQGLIAVVCSVDFCLFIKKQFHLKRWEFYITFLLSLFVYLIDFPEFINNHAIITEALAYPLFYVYMKFLLRGILNASYKDLFYNLGMAFVLSLLRSQLQLLWAVSALGISYCYIKKHWHVSDKKKIRAKTIYCGVAIVMAGMIVIAGMKAVAFSVSVIRDSYTKITAQEQEKEQNEKNEKKSKDVQGSSALWARVSYLIDEEDVELFANKESKEIFLTVYHALDEMEYRYIYRPRNLWTWNHIATAASRSGKVSDVAIRNYLKENTTVEPEQYWSYVIKTFNEMSGILLRAHWDRYLYYTLCMLPQGFICTVFFQKENFYALCHLITFLIYLFAIVQSCICLKRRKCNSRAGEQMLIIIAVSVMFVVITNLVFMGIQRYLYYMFGVFYIGLFIVFRETILRKIKDKLWKKY